MIQAFHGGSCCGMTHIFSFPQSPTQLLPALKRLTEQQVIQRTRDTPTTSRWRNNAFPSQPAIDRLKAIIHGIEAGVLDVCVYQHARPKGCIEVVLTESQCLSWEDTLLSLDFRVVNKFVNSNSSRTIKVFHRNSGAEGVKPIILDAPVAATPPVSPAPLS